jgi:adenosylhomocysteine nucleosidase
VATRRVAVLAAMVSELAPVVRRLALRPTALGGARAWAGRSGACEVVAAVTSIGTRAATDVTQRLLDRHPSDRVVVVGVCGAVDPRLELGALVVPQVVLDEASGRTYRPTPLGGVVAAGTLLTTDVLHRDPAKLDALRRAGVVAVDMESAAIGAASEARGVPWSVFRAVSDHAGDPLVDDELVALSNADGTANVRNVVRFLVRHPRRIPALVRLGAALRAAGRASTGAALAALEEHGAQEAAR